MASIALGQVFPDRYGDEHTGSCIVRKNDNQVRDTEGHDRPDIAAYFEGAPLGLFLRDSSRISFTYALRHQDNTIADTAYRVDMAISDGKYVSPDLLLEAPGVSNYYRGALEVEEVAAYRRGVYADVIDPALNS